jgi:hypothetical protein
VTASEVKLPFSGQIRHSFRVRDKPSEARARHFP